MVQFSVDGLHPLSKIEEKVIQERRDYDATETVRKFLNSRDYLRLLNILDMQEKNDVVRRVQVTKETDVVDQDLLDVLEDEESIRHVRAVYDKDVGAIVYSFEVNAQIVVEKS